MGRWNEMKEPESLEDYVARLAQEEESQSKILLAQAGPLGPAQLFAAEAPRPTPRPSPPADSWVQLPQYPEAGEAGSGYYPYGTDLSDRRGTHANAQWGEPRTMRVIGAAAGQLANGLAETPFGVGNISLEGGKSFKPHHKGHVDGLGVDIRPPRLDRKQEGVSYHDSQYDLEGTQRIVDALWATQGVDAVYFNDPRIKGVTPDKRGTRIHDNHLHAKIKP